MSATVINGKEISQDVLTNLGTQVAALGVPLHLAAVLVGDDPGLKSFVKIKQRAAQSVGIIFSAYFFSAAEKDEAQQTIRYLATDDSVDGIFVELPLPADWNVTEIASLIPTTKDVDALTEHPIVLPPSVMALQYVLREYHVPLAGKIAAIVGHGRLVGQPIAGWLREQGADVRVIDVTTADPAVIAAQADLVVCGVGKPGLVTGKWIKEGATVIDFGYADGTGDVDSESVKQKAGLLTPVPGGMGPLVVAAVLENLLTLATR